MNPECACFECLASYCPVSKCRIPDDLWPFIEQFRLCLIPPLHGLHRRLALQRWLRQLVVVQGHIAHQRLLHVLCAVEALYLQNIRYAAIEALDHSIGSGRPGFGQAMLYAHLLAQLVELMIAAGLALTAGKQPVRELLAVVGQQLGDLDRAAAGCGAVALPRPPGRA